MGTPVFGISGICLINRCNEDIDVCSVLDAKMEFMRIGFKGAYFYVCVGLFIKELGIVCVSRR
jgi:hypothetical protein